MTYLIALAAAVLFLWHTLLYWSPLEPPGYAKPLLVLALAAVASTLPLRPLEWFAAAGAVGVVNYFIES